MEMDPETIVQSADRAVYAATGKHLTDLQIAILRGTLDDQDYRSIARTTGKNLEHIRRIGAQLWKLLSQSLSEPVTKTNCREALRRNLLAIITVSVEPSVDQ
jgi:hypothetical protein